MATLTVGAGEEYATIAAAVAATQDGDTVLVNAGTYTNDFVTIAHKITLQSVGGLALLVATASPPNGKAIVTTDADATIDGFGFTGATVPDGNGAGIRYETGNLIVRNSLFFDNQNGILGANDQPAGTVLIQNSEFSHNGSGTGTTHNLYIGTILSLTVENSYFHDAVVGHEIKSRAANNIIVNNRIQDQQGNGSYSIDLPDGGNGVIENNVIEKGVNAENYTVFHFGGEGAPYAGSNLLISGNTIINDNANSQMINNQAGTDPVTLSNNRIYGFDPGSIAEGGTVIQSGNTVLTTRPTLDTTSIAPAVTVVGLTPPVLAVVPSDTVLTSFGMAGAVTASGHILTVGGAHGAFSTLAQALAASQDGDTIEVAAGTYTDDYGTVNHKVIIEGVGGIATFTGTHLTSSGAAYLAVNTDLTIKNLAFTNGSSPFGGRQAGLYISAGNVTVENSIFSNNDLGIGTADNPATTLSIYNSDFGPNGNAARGTDNISVGVIGSFTLKGSYVHDAQTGHEVHSLAYNTDIENNRIIDGDTTQSSELIDLGRGGNAIIANNMLVKGRNSTNDLLVAVGGEGATYDNSAITVSGNTLVSNMVNPYHPYTYFIVGNSDLSVLAPITASGNTFVGGVPGSGLLNSVTDGGGNVVAATASYGTASPVTASLAPALFRPSLGANTLILTLSGNAADVAPQFYVTVDGAAVGGGTVLAQEGSGALQSFVFTGWWAQGQHTVAVVASNVSGDGPQGGDIAIASISLDGAAATPSITDIDHYGNTATVSLVGKTILPDFDAAYYLAMNPDVKAAGVDPLTHYLIWGWHEGRNPNAWFNTNYYENQNPDVRASGVNPLLQFESTGWQEGRDPSVLFSTSSYLAANPDVAAAGMDPLQHYLDYGQTEGRAIYAATPHLTTTTDPLIDPAYYFAQNPAAAATGIDAGVSYHSTTANHLLNPDAWFDTTYYLMRNPDVAAAGVNPLDHYEGWGWKEGRDPNPYFSTSAYEAANPDAAATGINPLALFLSSGDAPAYPSASSPYLSAEAKAFDATYYLAMNPDVAAAHADPLVHYEEYGWKEGRNPSAAFSTSKYLAAYADVKAANTDPFAQYLNTGAAQGRQEFSV